MKKRIYINRITCCNSNTFYYCLVVSDIIKNPKKVVAKMAGGSYTQVDVGIKSKG